MKKILIVLLATAVLIIGAVWYFVSFRLDDMIREQIESTGSQLLDTKVSVGEVTTDLRSGSLAISSIVVANPEGYENENAFTLSGIEAALDYETSNIKRLIINRPQIVIEEQAGRTNFTDLLNNIERTPEDPPAETSEPPPVITIQHFRMSEASAAFESKSTDRYTDVKVRSVELHNLSGTPDEVGAAILEAIIEKTVAAAAVELLRAKATEKLEGLFE